ncbi:TetR/AcrR family transcriptional regulator [Faecalicatena sp. AGMB00832]|uniref:TetR/AcrR family transcriptional regulator n=1 Tax=Faecalicatena faecalis TaxID=2726362 RepID=A0ABS6CYI4_9FIRM|nr:MULTISPECIES: TetR/AcrR family transcriptional regulator [Faecalicatena]MBU3874387.1 TetR/AcrR family transcriptional regulator [Faecalicatena faecalis]MCI6464957.1 TetR/AcrR family transcriptional regulator [Faecalicatena sp.]MDY5617838.1 TetR/AcrR family transcriptional regulator [Lachnospiraceae bacterium]
MPRKKQTTKSKIVKAAWNLFYKNGYDNTTVEDIIKLSKTSKGTFYHYFKGKDALLTTLSDLFDQQYEEINNTLDQSLSAREKLLLLNHELFYMIETSIDINLLASLYSSQLITKDNRSLLDDDRYYFQLITEIIENGIRSNEFKNTSSVEELVKIYTMYERALLYDWALCEGKYSLSVYSDRLLPHVLDNFEQGL